MALAAHAGLQVHGLGRALRIQVILCAFVYREVCRGRPVATLTSHGGPLVGGELIVVYLRLVAGGTRGAVVSRVVVDNQH